MRLTPRQAECQTLMQQGLKQVEIAQKMGIHRQTAGMHVRLVNRKRRRAGLPTFKGYPYSEDLM